MAILMKTLMDEFYALSKEARNDDDFEGSMAYSNAESLANNCHQYTPEQIFEYLRGAFTHNKSLDFTTEKAAEAYDECLKIVAKYEQQYNEYKASK